MRLDNPVASVPPNGGEQVFEVLSEAIRSGVGAIPDVAALARTTRADATELQAIFQHHAHLTPEAFLERERVRWAGRALRVTRDSEQDIAAASGYVSYAAFLGHFEEVNRLAPGAYRSIGEADHFVLSLPPGYIARAALDHAAMDPGALGERVKFDQAHIWKAIAFEADVFTLDITFLVGQAVCQIHSSTLLSPGARYFAHQVALKMLGLNSSAWRDFTALRSSQETVAALMGDRAGLYLPQTATAFEALVWGVVGQQISINFAAELRAVLVRAGGRTAPLGLIAHATPDDVAKLDEADLIEHRFSRAKASYMLGAARAIAAGDLQIEQLSSRSAEAAQRELLHLRGIGPWTARYTLMRGAGFADFAPIGDSGLAAGLQQLFKLPSRPTPGEAERLMLEFSPHRSIATAHLWALIHSAAAEKRNAKTEFIAAQRPSRRLSVAKRVG